MLEQLTRELVQQFADNGYPFAQAEMDGLAVEDSIVDVSFRLVSGPQVTVGSIDFPGLRTTKPEPLRKRISLSPGAIFRETDLSATRKTLSQLRHCYPAGEASLTYESRERVVNVALPLRDERNLAFEGLAYLNPDNTIAGQIDIELINPFGRGEEFGFIGRGKTDLSKLNSHFVLSLCCRLSAGFTSDAVAGRPRFVICGHNRGCCRCVSSQR